MFKAKLVNRFKLSDMVDGSRGGRKSPVIFKLVIAHGGCNTELFVNYSMQDCRQLGRPEYDKEPCPPKNSLLGEEAQYEFELLSATPCISAG